MSTHALDHHDRNVAEINIIPLADVLLVLLIIFMVTAPTATRAIGLDMPSPDRRVQPRPEPPLVLRIDAVGDVYRAGELVPMPALQAALEAEAAAAPDRPLRVDADDDADYQAVTQVLATAQRAGIADIGFARGG